MYESGQTIGASEQAWEGWAEISLASAHVGIAHAPLVLPHLSDEIPTVIKYDGNLTTGIGICEALAGRGLMTQDDLDGHKQISKAIETKFKSLFSKLEPYDTNISLVEMPSYNTSKNDGVKVQVESFFYEMGGYYIGDAIAELNALEAGLGDSFSKLFCTACNKLYRGWTPYDGWQRVFQSYWRYNPSYEDAMQEFLDEMNGNEEELAELDIPTEEKVTNSLGGKIELFNVSEEERESVIKNVTAKLHLMGKYEALTKASIDVIEDIKFAMSDFEQAYWSRVESFNSTNFPRDEIFIIAKKDDFFDHLFDQHYGEYMEVADESNATSMGWMLDNIDAGEISELVDHLIPLLDRREKFASLLADTLREDE